MLRTRIILVISAIALIALIFSLPRVVVENDAESVTQNPDQPDGETPRSTDTHTSGLDDNTQAKAAKLKQQLTLAGNSEKSITFADSLAELYLNANKYDSAARFFEIIADQKPTVDNWLRTADTYYEAYGFAMDRNKQALMGEKAREFYTKVMDANPDNLAVKNKIAMTYLSTNNPMQGIMMLREILQSDPDNEDALFNLGVLSMQSGQHDKAVERFSNLVSKYPGNTQAQFFLGVSYLEVGNKAKAREQFELVKSLDDDPAVQSTVDSYLENIE